MSVENSSVENTCDIIKIVNQDSSIKNKLLNFRFNPTFSKRRDIINSTWRGSIKVSHRDSRTVKYIWNYISEINNYKLLCVIQIPYDYNVMNAYENIKYVIGGFYIISACMCHTGMYKLKAHREQSQNFKEAQRKCGFYFRTIESSDVRIANWIHKRRQNNSHVYSDIKKCRQL